MVQIGVRGTETDERSRTRDKTSGMTRDENEGYKRDGERGRVSWESVTVRHVRRPGDRHTTVTNDLIENRDVSKQFSVMHSVFKIVRGMRRARNSLTHLGGA